MVDLEDLTADIGLSAKPATTRRTIERLLRFGFATGVTR